MGRNDRRRSVRNWFSREVIEYAVILCLVGGLMLLLGGCASPEVRYVKVNVVPSLPPESIVQTGPPPARGKALVASKETLLDAYGAVLEWGTTCAVRHNSLIHELTKPQQ